MEISIKLKKLFNSYLFINVILRKEKFFINFDRKLTCLVIKNIRQNF